MPLPYPLNVAVITCCSVVQAAVTAVLSSEACREESNRRRHAIRQCQRTRVLTDPETYMRCSGRSFETIVTMVERHWEEVNAPLGQNAYFQIRDRVAATLHYLTHPDAFNELNAVFGMSKASAVRYVWQVINVLLVKLGPKSIRLPQTDEERVQSAKEFEEIAGIPNVAGAIDGT